MFEHNQIVITSNIETAITKVKENLTSKNFLIFNPSSFLIDDAKDVIKESYISSKYKKYIILASSSFNIFAQNALLKILEEPPKNIIFILITSHKNALLPTVRSRVSITFWDKKNLNIDIDINFTKKNKEKSYQLYNELKNLPKEKAVEAVEVIFLKAVEENIIFNSNDMRLFSTSIKLLNQNMRTSFVLANIFSMLLSKKYDNI
jgi:DNA polymerase-3 subunit delta'